MKILYLITDADKAKWVGTDTSSDEDCDAATTVAGSSVGRSVGGITEFAFQKEVEAWILCYKHGSDNWRLYTSITPTTTTTTTTTTKKATSETQLTKATVSLTLEGNIASYPLGSTARTTFESAFLADLARALDADLSRFSVEDIQAGSIIVDFSISPTG